MQMPITSRQMFQQVICTKLLSWPFHTRYVHVPVSTVKDLKLAPARRHAPSSRVCGAPASVDSGQLLEELVEMSAKKKSLLYQREGLFERNAKVFIFCKNDSRVGGEIVG